MSFSEFGKDSFSSNKMCERPYKTFYNFFQSPKKRYQNLDPNSGVHLVGPMFELMAYIDDKKNVQDFDAFYPESGISYGPTICSFGLSYNDHNYALPTGLTPPSMAPHLIDLSLSQVSTALTVSSIESAPSPVSNCIFTPSNSSLASRSAAFKHYSGNEKQPGYHSHKSVKLAPPPPTTVAEDASIAASIAESTAGLSEPKKTLFRAWHAKAAATGGFLVVQQRWKGQEPPSSARYQQTSQLVDDMELRYDLDMKILEVPEDICVSPSQLSGLDSDSSDNDTEIDSSPFPDSGSLNEHQKSDNVPFLSSVRCICGNTIGDDSNLIQCTKCRLFQHNFCMRSIYQSPCSSPISVDTSTTSIDLLNPTTYLCYVCLPHTADPVLIKKAKDEMKKYRALAGLELLQHLDSDDSQSVKSSFSSKTVNGSQLLVNATDRAQQLGLINNCQDILRPEFHRRGDRFSRKSDADTSSTPVHSSRYFKRKQPDTDINLRVPSPPRASKRKQDLTSNPFVEVTRQPPIVPQSSHLPVDTILSTVSTPSTTPGHLTSGSITPLSTPLGTPSKPLRLTYHHHLQVYSLPSIGDSGCLQSPVIDGTGALPIFSDSTLSTPDKCSPGSHSSNKLSRRKNRRFSVSRRDIKYQSLLSSEWTKHYREADASTYSKALLDNIAENIASGREHNQRLPPVCLTRTQLCRVVLFDHDDKGLEASTRLFKDDVVAEVRGCLMLMEEYEHFVDPFTSLNRYVILYRDCANRGVAIDTTQYGNDARFIRRSCMPNCKLDHLIVCGKMHIFIRTTHDVMPCAELTLPFDIDYRACRFPIDCCCGRSRCPVIRWRRKLLRNKVMPNLDYSKYIENQLRVLSKPLSEEGRRSMPNLDYSFSLPNSPASKADFPSPVLTGRSVMNSGALLRRGVTLADSAPTTPAKFGLSPFTRRLVINRQIFPPMSFPSVSPQLGSQSPSLMSSVSSSFPLSSSTEPKDVPLSNVVSRRKSIPFSRSRKRTRISLPNDDSKFADISEVLPTSESLIRTRRRVAALFPTSQSFTGSMRINRRC